MSASPIVSGHHLLVRYNLEGPGGSAAVNCTKGMELDRILHYWDVHYPEIKEDIFGFVVGLCGDRPGLPNGEISEEDKNLISHLEDGVRGTSFYVCQVYLKRTVFGNSAWGVKDDYGVVEMDRFDEAEVEILLAVEPSGKIRYEKDPESRRKVTFDDDAILTHNSFHEEVPDNHLYRPNFEGPKGNLKYEWERCVSTFLL